MQAFNSVAETVDCKQFISYILVSKMTSCKTIYDDSNEFFLKLVWTLQLNSSFVQAWKTDRVKRKCSYVIKSLRWTFNKIKLLHYEKQLYISSETSIKAKLLRCHHDDVLARHFDIEWTLKLMLYKYYWSKLTKNIKKYVFSYNIYQQVKTSKHHSYSKMQLLSQLSDSW